MKQYLRLSIFLPLLIPVIPILLALGTQPFFDPTRANPLAQLAAFLWMSLFVAGIPYLVISLGLFIWSRKQSETKTLILVILLPVIFLLFFALYWLVLSAFGLSLADGGLSAYFSSVTYFTSFILVIGYSYVVLVVSGYYVIKRMTRKEQKVVTNQNLDRQRM